MEYRLCLIAKILTEAVGRYPIVVLPVAVLGDYIQVVIPSPPSLPA